MERCFIEASSVTEDLLSQFNIPFARNGGEYNIKYIEAVYNVDGKAEILMDIEQIRRGRLYDQLVRCGARDIIINTLPRGDASNIAGKLQTRVLLACRKPGMKSYQRGTCTVVPVFPASGFADEGAYNELKRIQLVQDAVMEVGF